MVGKDLRESGRIVVRVWIADFKGLAYAAREDVLTNFIASLSLKKSDNYLPHCKPPHKRTDLDVQDTPGDVTKLYFSPRHPRLCQAISKAGTKLK